MFNPNLLPVLGCAWVRAENSGWLHGTCECVTRRKQHRPGIAPNANTTHVQTQEAVQAQRNQTIL